MNQPQHNHKHVFFVDSKTGKQYTNLNDVPPQMRSRMEKKFGSLNDANQDGIPDSLEQHLPKQGVDFNIQGQQYTSFDQIPAEQQEQLKKVFGGANPFQNQGAWMNLLKHGTHLKGGNSMFNINVDGQHYLNIDQMPEETKEKLKEIFGHLKDEDHDGIPDMFQGGIFKFFKGLSQLHPTVIMKNQGEQFAQKIDDDSDPKTAQGKKSDPIKLMTTKEDRSEKWRIILVALLVLGVGVYFGWEWILDFLAKIS